MSVPLVKTPISEQKKGENVENIKYAGMRPMFKNTKIQISSPRMFDTFIN